MVCVLRRTICRLARLGEGQEIMPLGACHVLRRIRVILPFPGFAGAVIMGFKAFRSGAATLVAQQGCSLGEGLVASKCSSLGFITCVQEGEMDAEVLMQTNEEASGNEDGEQEDPQPETQS